MNSDRSANIRGRNVVNGILSGSVGRSVSLVAPFLVMPELLGYIGESRFGVWMTLVSLTSMAAFVDFGIGNGLLTQLSRSYGAQNHCQMRSIIASAYGMLGMIGAILLAIIVGLVFVTESWMVGSSVVPLSNENRQIIWVVLTAFAIGIPVSAIHRILLALQQNIYTNILHAVGSAFSVIGCIAVIRMGSEPWLAVAVYAFSPIVCTIIGTGLFFIKNHELRLSYVDWSLRRAGDLLALGSSFFILSVVISIALNIDNLLISSILGPAAVTEYAIPAKLASLLGLMMTTLFLPLWAANGEALQRKDFNWIKKSTKKMMISGGIAVGLAGLFLTVMGETIVRLWMSREFDGSTMIIAMFSLFYLLNSIVSPGNMVLNSAGKVKIQIYAWTIFLILSVVGKYLALSIIGSNWVVPLISTIIFALSIMPIVINESRKIFQRQS